MSFQRLYDATPRLDCGACGAPTCRAFARRTVARKTSPDECPLLRRPEYADCKAKLEAQLRSMPEDTHEAKAIPELANRVMYFRPCAEDVSKVSAETRLERRFHVPPVLRLEVFDPSSWDWMLRPVEFFENVRCSEGLGVARIEARGMTIMAFRDGRANVRAAPDEREARAVIRLVARTLWGSLICGCGNTAMDCAGGACLECSKGVCPALEAEPFAQGAEAAPLLSNMGGYQYGSPSTVAAQIARMLENMVVLVVEGRQHPSPLDDAVQRLIEARRIAVRMLAAETDSLHALGALRAMGVLSDLERVIDALSIISRGCLSGIDASREPAKRALRVFSLSSQALSSGLPAVTRVVQEEFEAFRAAWSDYLESPEQIQILLALHKVAANGLYLSRASSCIRQGVS